jgi:hypothetical protein
VTEDETERDWYDKAVEAGRRFVVQVLTIAVGTCLGILLFVWVAWHIVENKLHDVQWPTTPTTSVQPPPSWTP